MQHMIETSEIAMSVPKVAFTISGRKENSHLRTANS
jgi:hypothetical protein